MVTLKPSVSQIVDRPVPPWNWSKFKGSSDGLKWNRKELDTVRDVLARVPTRRVVVQAGGNLGIFPKYLSGVFETVYTFEPEPELFEIMCHNAPERNIVKNQAVLGFDRKLVGMSRRRRQQDGGVAHEGITHVSGDGVIPTLRIDDLNLPVCDLIYLDIEGYELFALQGAAQTLARCRPVLACEINKSLVYMDYTEEDVRMHIRLQGYEFVERIRSDDIFVPL